VHQSSNYYHTCICYPSLVPDPQSEDDTNTTQPTLRLQSLCILQGYCCYSAPKVCCDREVLACCHMETHSVGFNNSKIRSLCADKSCWSSTTFPCWLHCSFVLPRPLGSF